MLPHTGLAWTVHSPDCLFWQRLSRARRDGKSACALAGRRALRASSADLLFKVRGFLLSRAEEPRTSRTGPRYMLRE